MNLANIRVLLTDDHFLIRQFFRRTLMDAGINTIEMVNDGNEAMEAIAHSLTGGGTLYDIVMLDWNMPHMAGIDVLAYIRSKPQYQNSAVVMFTAESEKANIMKAIKMGATTYILKPISPADLTKKIREVIDWLTNRRVGKV